MRMFSKLAVCGLVGGLWAQIGAPAWAADAGASGPLQFKFELNKPIVYSAVSTTRTVTDRTVQMETGAKSVGTTNAGEFRFKLRLTPIRKSAEGVWTLHYEPFDFQEDVETFANGGHFTTAIKGLEVKSTQNGITVVDTAKGVGLAQAKPLKQGTYVRMLSGNFEFEPSGLVSKVDGDLPFIDYWSENIKNQMGLFDISFASEPVPAGGTWTKNLVVKDLEGIKLGESGLVETNTYVRQDGTGTANHLIPITVSMTISPKNIFGSMDNMGQNTTLNISEFTHQKTGKFLFDSEAGCLNSGDEEEARRLVIDMLSQGHTVTVTTELSIHSKFDLLTN